MNQDVSLTRPSSSDCQLAMSSVHWVSSLESHDASPTQFLEMCSKLGWGVSKRNVVIVVETVDSLDLTTNIVFFCLVHQVLDGWVFWITAKDLLTLKSLVWLVDIIDCKNGQVAIIAEISESDSGSGLDISGIDDLLANIQADGHAKKSPIRKSEVFDHAIVVLLVHKTLER